MHEHRDNDIGQALNTLPVPPASDEFFTELRGRTESRRRSYASRPLATFAAAGLALIVGGVIGAFVLSPSTGAATSSVPVFRATNGWNTLEANIGGGLNVPVALAANVPLQLDTSGGHILPPLATLKSLPPNGIVIGFGGPTPWEYTGHHPLPQLSFPLNLSQMHFVGESGYEGQPAPNVSQYLLSGFVHDKHIGEAFVWMGTLHPSQDMIDAANKELAELQLP